MSWHRANYLAGCPGAGGPRDALRPCDLYPAARLGSPGAAEPPPPLWPALSHGRPDPPGHRRGPETSRGGDWRLRRAAHLGPTTAPPSPSPWCPPRRGDRTGWGTVGAVSSPLLLACPGPLATLPAPLPRWPGATLRTGPALLHGALSGARRAHPLAAAPRHPGCPGVGGLRQRAPPGSPARPHLPGPLYASCRHLEPPARRLGGRPGDLPLQGLRAWPPPAYPHARGRSIPAAADAACPAARLP